MKLELFPSYTPYDRADDLAEVNSISGGRSSGFLQMCLINGGFGKQKNHFSNFENTGEEDESCYLFLKQIEQHTGIKINMLEYTLTEIFINELIYSSFSYEKFQNCEYTSISQILNLKKLKTFVYTKSPNSFWYKQGFSHPTNSILEVNYDTAHRNGKPLADIFIYYSAIRIMKGLGLVLPSVGNRWCTGATKEQISDRWLASKGIKEYISYKGMRYDEPDRVAKVKAKNEKQNNIFYEAPLSDLKITQSDVLLAWLNQPFDLGMNEKGERKFISAIGNCKRCHLKAEIKKLWLIQQGYKNCTLKQMEILANNYNGDTDAMARSHGTYEYLEKKAASMPLISIDQVLNNAEKEISCFGCGD